MGLADELDCAPAPARSEHSCAKVVRVAVPTLGQGMDPKGPVQRMGKREHITASQRGQCSEIENHLVERNAEAQPVVADRIEDGMERSTGRLQSPTCRVRSADKP